MNACLDHRRMDDARTAAMAFLLEKDGFCVARDIMPATTLAAINHELDEDFRGTPFCEGAFYGDRTKRFGRLLARSTAIADLVLAPTILALVRQVLGPWCDTIQLNVAQAIEIHPGALAQYPHRDQDMWPDASGSHEYLINVIWPLDPFTEDNGSTMIWPDSHGAAASASVDGRRPIAATSMPGDAIIFLGSTLHAAGANRSNRPRRALVIGYSLGWLKPYENPWLAYPPEIARCFHPDLAALAGYRQHRPNLGNYEGQCPSILLTGNAPERLAAVDALRPEQTAALAAYVEEQRRQSGAARVATAPMP